MEGFSSTLSVATLVFFNIKFKLDSIPNPSKWPCLPTELLTRLLLNNRRKQNNY